MDWFSNILRAWGPRVIGSVAGVAATKITESTGISVDPAVLIGVGTIVYSGVHKAISAHVNPGDAANGRVVTAEKQAAAVGTTVVVAPSR